jgi:hypothetical protein
MSENDLSIQQQKAAVLHQMGQIPYIIRGKLSSQTYVAKGRSQGPYFTLQRWEQGKNKSQRIPPQQLPMIQEAVTGFERFQQLADQFVGLTEQQTWEAQPADLKKKFRQFSLPPFPTPAPSSKKRASS